MLKRIAGPETTVGHPDAGSSIVIRQWVAHKLLVSLIQAFGLEWRRYRFARIRFTPRLGASNNTKQIDVAAMHNPQSQERNSETNLQGTLRGSAEPPDIHL